MRLFVDDVRVPPDDGRWEVARTVTDAIRILSSTSVEVISLDHDIAVNQSSLHTFSDENFSTVARYLAVMNHPPKLILVHSASRYGTQNIQEILAGTASKLIRISPTNYLEEIKRALNNWGQQPL